MFYITSSLYFADGTLWCMIDVGIRRQGDDNYFEVSRVGNYSGSEIN